MFPGIPILNKNGYSITPFLSMLYYMSDKSSRWQFTAYEEQFTLFNSMPPGIAEWGWNTEICPKTNRTHYQGYLRLQSQQRFAWLRKLLPGVHIEIAKNWTALVQYCQKEDTRAPGTEPEHQINDIPTQFSYAEEVANRIVKQELLIMSANPNHIHFRDWSLEEAHGTIETLVRSDIATGRRGIQWIASNPNWKVMWKAFWKECLLAAFRPKKTDRQTDVGLISPAEYNPDATPNDESQETVPGSEEE